ncbi:Acyl-[acyl-carrier-protein]--UDP-N-acetylglucosamine O-acyltransferase [Symmachiella dynata]|uniref:Acyl-[acyl-carrier-protein]--UDP-N-acetylglucosamine O-acyltransferase n=1 Tax=Symmachiella dynata TaxID=2527995 RepID=A0A517ZUU1_9PLAN|nr:acyl-ACP--UDP-N-acetylglucosamine O-acyltransferase [Symmachiella dynata]QDU46253.1 Acyl-[acyl-carrier-protein]--UDP-N-acetylglucosamine O-acyltransferase [Symmachiella dynata]
MSTQISAMASVDPQAIIGADVQIGPFCVIGPGVQIGDRTKLISHVAIHGPTTIGTDNCFHPTAVIGGDPQDLSFSGAETRLEIGNGNTFREGVTVNRGAEKEEGVTRIGNNNMLMANSHVAHNCQIANNVILVNGVLLGGHVQVQDNVIISGNSVVHHFSTLGTLSFIGGLSRVPHDVPPYMMWVGGDDSRVRTINIVGMQRRGISNETIRIIKKMQRLIYRDCKKIEFVAETLHEQLGNDWPAEVTNLMDFLGHGGGGRQGRRREVPKAA